MEEDLITIMAGQSDQALQERIETAYDVMEKNYAANFYTKIQVLRRWSEHSNGIIFDCRWIYFVLRDLGQ